MSLEFQLSTVKAEQALERVSSAVTAFENKLKGMKAAKIDIDLTGVKLPTGDASGLVALTKAANGLSRVNAVNITAVATALGSFRGINLGGAAASVQNLAQALSAVKPPRNLERTATNIGNIGLAARSASGPVATFKTALGGIQTPPGLTRLPSSFNAAGSAARNASGGVSSFNQVLGALGITAGAAGLNQFVSSAMEASTTITQFGNKVEAALGEVPGAAKIVGEQLEFVRKTADTLALPLDTSMHAFSKLTVSMLSAGNSIEDVQGVFTGFAKGFRAMGLSASQTDRAFNAINQTFSKGTVSMEELRQQLGEVFPAFQELAASTGMSTEELIKNIAQGKISSQTFIKLADDIGNKFGPAAEKAAKSGQSAMIRFGNAIFEMKARFGTGFFDGIAGGLDRLTKSLNTEAIRNFAQVAGTALGTALSLAADALTFITGNTYVFGAALTALGAIGASALYSLTASVLGLIPGVGLLRGGLLGLVSGVVRFTGALMGLPMAASAMGTLGTAFRAVAIAAAPMTLQLIATTLIIGGLVAAAFVVGVALGSLVQWFERGGSYSEIFSNNMGQLKERASLAASGIYESITSFVGFGGAAKKAGDAAVGTAEGLTKIEAGADQAGTGLDNVQPPADQAADSLDTLETNSGNAAAKVAELATSGGQAAGAMSRLAGDLVDATNNANRAAASFDRAAAAANRLSTAKARAEGGRSDSSSRVPSGSGGIANISSGSSRSVSAPASAFANAPHFSGGTANTSAYSSNLPGGGIAAVLHPNEAVVPLAGGGSIPISVSGGGRPSAQTGNNTQGPSTITLLQMQYDVMSDIKIEVTRVWEATDHLITTVKNEWARGHGGMALIANRIYELDKTMTAMGSRLSSGGSGSGGGTSGGDYGSSDGDVLSAVKDARRQIASNNVGRKTSRSGGGGIGYMGSDGRFYADYSYSPDYETNKGIDAQNASINQGLIDQYGAEAVLAAIHGAGTGAYTRALSAYNKQQSMNANRPQQTGHNLAFATGSPNAWRDASGGFQATLHPDEAVIPLPDGRSVPVSFPEGFMSDAADNTTSERQTRRVSRDDGAASGSNRPVYNITMNIQTPDAGSFRRTEGQIMNELRTQLDRSKARNGPARPSVDDPTKRVTN